MQTSIDNPSTNLAADLLRESSDQRVVIADGYNVRICTRNAQLCIEDGIATGKRTRIVSRTDGIKRLVILSETGFVTLEAMRWCSAEAVAVMQIDRDGLIVMCNLPAYLSATTRLNQAVVSAGALPDVRMRIVRHLITAKMEGQSKVAFDVFGRDDIGAMIGRYTDTASKAITPLSLSGSEGNAAWRYWSMWTDTVHVPFDPAILGDIPPHWLTYKARPSGNRFTGQQASNNRNRRSDDTESANRGATDVINAMLNYVYKVAESEAVYACLAFGLDPALGFLHSVRDTRQSLALDLLEVARPVCERIALSFMDTGLGVPYDNDGKPRYFSPDWVYEGRHGVVRLFAPLTHMICAHALEIAEVIRPHARDIASILARVHVPDLSVPLSQKQLHRASMTGPKAPFRTPLQRMPEPAGPSDVISDEAWQVISKRIPIDIASRGSTRRTDREVLAAMVYCAANGLSTGQIPASIAVSKQTVQRRRSQWQSVGAWPGIIRAVRQSVLPGFTG